MKFGRAGVLAAIARKKKNPYADAENPETHPKNKFLCTE